MKRKQKAAVLIAVSVLVYADAAHAASITSTFDTGLEGWTATGGLLQYSSAGGNPSGFLSLTDNMNDYMTVFAPMPYSGNLLGFLGGTLSFDARNLNGAAADLVSTPHRVFWS
jgi:hypothetical protein